jgi:hypothetical protein
MIIMIQKPFSTDKNNVYFVPRSYLVKKTDVILLCVVGLVVMRGGT